MDPNVFDGMIRRLSASLPRRALVAGSFGAAVIGVLGHGQDAAIARKRSRRVVSSEQACIQTGRRCPSKKPRGKKGKNLGCNDCCQDATNTVTNAKGKSVVKCACKTGGTSCTNDMAFQCCSGICNQGVCQGASCAAVGQACSATTACCTGSCVSGTCQVVTCGALGTACTVGAQCCSGACNSSPGLTCCLPENAPCTGPGQCCTAPLFLACAGSPMGTICLATLGQEASLARAVLHSGVPLGGLALLLPAAPQTGTTH